MYSIDGDILKQPIVTLPTSGSNNIDLDLDLDLDLDSVWVDEYVDTIKGEMFVVDLTVSDLEVSINTLSPDDFMDQIKTRLLEKMLTGLRKSKSIEFTRMNDTKNHQTIFKARIFATPDDQVRILRKAGK